jgi:phage protein D/phage baseplate assembly protein gpV
MAAPASAAATTRTPTIKVVGSALAPDVAKNLISMRVQRSVYVPATVSLRFFDDFYELFDRLDINVGDELEVLLPDSDSSVATVFLGKVAQVGIEQGDQAGDLTQRIVVEAQDVSHRLANASDFTAYLDHTSSDIVEAIADRHGLKAVTDATSDKAYRIQTCTDLHFLTQLASGIGYEWFVHGRELHFRKRPQDAGPELSPRDGTLRAFSASFDGARAPGTVTVTGWDPAAQSSVSGSWDAGAAPPIDVLRADSSFATSQYRKAVSAFGNELIVPTEGAEDAKSATDRSEVIGHDLARHGVSISGITICNPAVEPGRLVTLSGVGRKLAGDYYVTDVIHEYGEGQELLTHFASDGPPSDLGANPNRASGPFDGWSGRGLVAAYVTSIKDPKKLGRIKVTYPSLRDQHESEWARVITPGAGKDRGLDFRPEVGDEVVVGFERGHVDKPLVLGGLWSEKFKPPFDDIVEDSGDGVVSKRVIASRVGHSITMSDGNGPEDRHIDLALNDGETFVYIGEDKITVESPGGNPIELKSGSASLTITDGGDLKIQAASLDIKVDGSAKIEGQDIALKGSMGVKVDGGSAFEAKGGTAKVEGQSMAEFKGGMVKIN